MRSFSKLFFCGLILFSSVSVAVEEKKLEKMGENCNKLALAAFEKAREDTYFIIGFYGGNLGVSVGQGIERQKEGFLALYSQSCFADAIRKSGVKRPVPD